MKKLLATGLTLAAATVALAGCAGQGVTLVNQSPDSGGLKYYSVPLADGKNVDCVGSIYSGTAYVPTCDWENIYEGPRHSEEAGWLGAYLVENPSGGSVVCVASIYTGVAKGADCDWPTEG